MQNRQSTDFDPGYQGPEEDEGLDIQEYFRVIQKHRNIVLASLVLSIILVGLWTHSTIPVYRATSLIVIDNQSSKSPLTGERMNYESYFSETSRFKTHATLLTSRAVLEQVAANLDLHAQKQQPQKNASGFKGFLKEMRAGIRLKDNIETITGQDAEKTVPGNRIDRAVARLKSKVKVKEVTDTMLYEISVDDPDPVFARDAANSLGQTYIEFDIANRAKYSKNSFQWMSGQFYEVEKKLEDAERDFLNYKQEQKLFSVEGRQDEILYKIREANNSYIESRNNRLEIESKLKEINSSSKGSKENFRAAISLLNNLLLNSLYNQLIEAEMEKNRLSKVFKGKHPKMIQVNSRIDDITETIFEEIDKEKSNLEASLKALKAREIVFQKTVDDYEDEALTINRKQLQYTILQRDVETNQRLHDTLLAKLKEADITDTMVVSNIRVAEIATVPKAPFKPNKKRNFLLSVIVGLMIGVGLAFLRENIDRTLHTEEDVQRVLALTVLSVIPRAEKAKDGSYGGKDRRNSKDERRKA